MDRIEPYGDEGKYKLIFAEPAKPLPRPIPFADATTGSMQGPRYTSLTKLLATKRVTDLFTYPSRSAIPTAATLPQKEAGRANHPEIPEGSPRTDIVNQDLQATSSGPDRQSAHGHPVCARQAYSDTWQIGVTTCSE